MNKIISYKLTIEQKERLLILTDIVDNDLLCLFIKQMILKNNKKNK